MGILAELNPTQPEKNVIDAARAGTVAKFDSNGPEVDRTVRASIIYKLAIESEKKEAPVHAKGIKIKGAIIDGELDFEAAKIKKPIELSDCEIRKPIILRYADTRSIKLDGSTVPEIDAEGLKVNGSLYLGKGFVCKGQIGLRGAEVKGDLDARSATFGTDADEPLTNSNVNPNNAALDADGILIEGSLYIGAGLHAYGEVRLRGAEIKGDLDADGGIFENAGGTAIDADGVTVEDDVLFGWSDETEKYGDPCRFTANGQIKLEAAQIHGTLDCRGGKFSNIDGESTLVANGVRIHGDFIAAALRDTDKDPQHKFESNGTVQLAGARIQGTFNGTKGIFAFVPVKDQPPAQDKPVIGAAIYADGIRVDGDIELRNSEIKGTVRLRGGSVEGDIYCNGMSIDALTDKFVNWKEHFEKRARDEEGLSNRAKAINADGLDLKGDLFLTDKFSSLGQVRLRSARIGGDLDCSEKCKFKNNFGTAFRIQGAQIAGRFTWKDHCNTPVGEIDFTHATVGRYDDDDSSWPEEECLNIDGFTYGALVSEDQTKADRCLKWLAKQPANFVPQPYEHLTKVLRSMGHEKDAKEIAIKKNIELRKWKYKKDKTFKVFLHYVFEWVWNFILRYLLSYGYKIYKVLILISVIILVGFLVFEAASVQNFMRPAKERIFASNCYLVNHGNDLCVEKYLWEIRTKEPYFPNSYYRGISDVFGQMKNQSVFRVPKDYPEFNAFVYSLDTFFPIVNLHQEIYWTPAKSIFRTWLWIQIGFGWFLTTLAVFGLSGIIKQE